MTINLKNLLNPNIKISKMGEFQELKQIEGLSISAVSADLYYNTGSFPLRNNIFGISGIIHFLNPQPQWEFK